jgi:hypothetical protein
MFNHLALVDLTQFLRNLSQEVGLNLRDDVRDDCLRNSHLLCLTGDPVPCLGSISVQEDTKMVDDLLPYRFAMEEKASDLQD